MGFPNRRRAMRLRRDTPSEHPMPAHRPPMHGLFWQPCTRDLPICEQEYYELALESPPNAWGDFYLVQRTRFEWDDASGQMLPADYVIDRAKTLEAAKARYALHRQMLSEIGFTHFEYAVR